MTKQEYDIMMKDAQRRSNQYVIGWPDDGLCTVNGIKVDEYCRKHFGADVALFIDEDNETIGFEIYIPKEGQKKPKAQSIEFDKAHMHLLQRMIPNLNQLIGLSLAIDKSNGPSISKLNNTGDEITFSAIFK